MIEARDLTVTLGKHTIVAGQTLTCAPGTLTALVGPSGSGKTTLLHALGLLLPVASGRLSLGGADVTRAGDGARRRFWQSSAAFVLQDYGIIDDESVAFNVTLRGGRAAGRADVAAVLDHVGLAGRGGEQAAVLSGGEKQRLAVARALYKRARVVFVDEPTASLDAENRARIVRYFRDLANQGATVVAATHDDEFVAACDARHEVR
ncbi:ATP-binding cassette domain-containing protein [Micrococcales bacterium 31B]|nr:ATP-binding cassette domain-containing protein [Micrococcales bacterium 31B]